MKSHEIALKYYCIIEYSLKNQTLIYKRVIICIEIQNYWVTKCQCLFSVMKQFQKSIITYKDGNIHNQRVKPTFLSSSDIVISPQNSSKHLCSAPLSLTIGCSYRRSNKPSDNTEQGTCSASTSVAFTPGQNIYIKNAQ